MQGENLRYSYARLLSLWQPFQYEFLVIATPGEVATIEAILGEHADETKAWRLYEQRAIAESRQEPNNVYPLFNQSIAAHYLGKYPQAVLLYEQVASRLPSRMLWYQIQPIDAYLQVGNYSQVFAMTDQILRGPNKAFSELYLLRGQAHERLGNTEAARREYELAVLYNQNLRLAQEALDSL